MSIQISLSDEAAEILWQLIKNQLEGSQTPLWTIEESAEMDKIMDRITDERTNPMTKFKFHTRYTFEQVAAMAPNYPTRPGLIAGLPNHVSVIGPAGEQYDFCGADEENLVLVWIDGPDASRLATLETAARAVCEARWSDERIKAIEELGRVLGEVE